jgi:hypothetical protein
VSIREAIRPPVAPAPAPEAPHESLGRRLAPTLVAAAFALAYVILSPPSLDLAAHELRANLFASEGFGLWNNWWYAGHHTPGYSVLFPPLGALLTPQIVAGLAAVGSAAVFDVLARARYGRRALLGAVWFGAATAVDLYTGRLTFALGLLPALGTALALQRRRDGVAALLGAITALCSPVAALFAALAAVTAALVRYATDRHAFAPRHRRIAPAVRALAVAGASVAPLLVLAVLFPEGGSEPFTLATLWPIPVIGVIALVLLPRRERALRIGVALYVLGCLASYAVATPVGSNAARLAPLVAGPMTALVWWQRRRVLLLLVAVPLVYMQLQAPVRDVRTSWGDPSVQSAYYQPLLSFLSRQSGPPFRIEIPFTLFHWEAYKVAPRFPIARGWERQLDVKDNHLFYGARLDARTYEAWLRSLAVRFVAVSSGSQDYSAKREIALIDRGLPYLRLVLRTAHWRVYEVRDPTPLADPPGAVTALGPNSVTLSAAAPGSFLVRVRFTPYWALSGLPGCVAPAGPFTRVRVRRPGTARLVISFALDRIAAHSRRCN